MNIQLWILQTIALMLTAALLPQLKITGILGAFATVVGLSLINAHIWDAALFFELPNSLGSQTLTRVLANGALFWLLVKLIPGIEISGILGALISPIVFSIMCTLVYEYGHDVDFLKLGESALAYIIELRHTLLSGSSPATSSVPTP